MTTHILLSTGWSCRCSATEKPKRLPGSPFFLNTFFVSKLNARAPAHRSKSSKTRTLKEILSSEISMVLIGAQSGEKSVHSFPEKRTALYASLQY